MLYLSTPPNAAREKVYREHRIGLMYTPNMSNRIDILDRVCVWAADTGCYSRGYDFDLDAYLRWLDERRPYADRCLFATAPDVVGDAQSTWARSAGVLPLLREMGYRAALVAQDGIEDMAVDWQAFDVLFVGGSTEWKLSRHAYELVQEARGRGKWVHVGRVNSRRRLQLVTAWGADSADGTYVAFGPDVNLPALTNWLTEVNSQQSFLEVA